MDNTTQLTKLCNLLLKVVDIYSEEIDKILQSKDLSVIDYILESSEMHTLGLLAVNIWEADYNFFEGISISKELIQIAFIDPCISARYSFTPGKIVALQKIKQELIFKESNINKYIIKTNKKVLNKRKDKWKNTIDYVFSTLEKIKPDIKIT